MIDMLDVISLSLLRPSAQPRLHSEPAVRISLRGQQQCSCQPVPTVPLPRCSHCRARADGHNPVPALDPTCLLHCPRVDSRSGVEQSLLHRRDEFATSGRLWRSLLRPSRCRLSAEYVVKRGGGSLVMSRVGNLCARNQSVPKRFDNSTIATHRGGTRPRSPRNRAIRRPIYRPNDDGSPCCATRQLE